MPRTISPASITKLSQQYGAEPINIIEIQWVKDGQRISYADRDITGGIKGKILNLSGLDDVIQVSGGGQSQQISLTLDDTDGSIKDILDNNDVHKRPCWVYQWFNGLPTSDKFLIFKGEVSSPLEWNEGDRTVSFDIISKIEDTEVGFSIEEGDFVNPPEELIGKPWPLCFGTCINVPALRAQSVRQGTLATGFGIRDFTLERRIALANKIVCPLVFVGWHTHYDFKAGGVANLVVEPTYEFDKGCLKSKCEEIERMTLELSEQSSYERDTIQIFGGETFPQHKTITLDVDGAHIRGKFSGDIFHISSRQHPQLDTATGLVIQTDVEKTIESACPGTNVDPNPAPAQAADPVAISQRNSKLTWDAFNSIKAADFFWATPGATVTIVGDDKILYIANLLPSTVLRVAAWRSIQAGRQLLSVPSSYYTVRETDYTGYENVTEIVFNKPLSTRAAGWEDEIFVTLTSEIGPNTVDILRWFIETYTPYGIDSTSFDAVEDFVENYPMHFPLLERKNIIQVLEEISFQARCALWLKDDVFYIKYLPAEPTADDTITESDIEANSMSITHTSTEDLVTKYVGTWKKDYSHDKSNTIILRGNVAKYGTHEENYDFYCFNILDLVRKAATFWLIRKMNTWRRVIFKTPIHKLKLEVFDTVSLTLPDLASGTIKGIVEKANYNSDDHTIDFECWTPLKSGTKTAYDFAWPAGIAEQLLFPTIEERKNKLGGSGKEPNFSVIAPKAHPLAQTTAAVSGFTVVCNGDSEPMDLDLLGDGGNGICRSDHGEKHPSDVGDQKPNPNAASDDGGSGNVNVSTSPVAPGQGEAVNCCKNAEDALRKAEQALKEAQQARQEAAQSKQPDGTEKANPNENLADVCGGPCSAHVIVQKGFITRVNKKPPEVGTSDTQGAKGRTSTVDDAGSDCYTFNSLELAKQFSAQKLAEFAEKDGDWTWVVDKGNSVEFNVVFTSGALENAEDGSPCTEPPATEQRGTGFHKGSIDSR